MKYDKSNKDIETQFNIGLVSLFRLHEELEQCNYYSKMAFTPGNQVKAVRLWKASLNVIKREISSKLIDKERDNVEKFFEKLNGKGFMIRRKTPYGSFNQIVQNRFENYCNHLNRIETLLRYYADKKGMLVPNKPSGDWAIAEME